MGTGIKHPMPGRVKPSFVIFDIRALWRSGLSECPDVKNCKWWLNPAWHRMLYSCTHVAPLGVKGLTSRGVPHYMLLHLDWTVRGHCWGQIATPTYTHCRVGGTESEWAAVPLTIQWLQRTFMMHIKVTSTCWSSSSYLTLYMVTCCSSSKSK